MPNSFYLCCVLLCFLRFIIHQMPQPIPHISNIKPVKITRNMYPRRSHPVIVIDIAAKIIVNIESRITGNKRITLLFTLKQSKSWIGKSTTIEKIEINVVSSMSPIQTSNIYPLTSYDNVFNISLRIAAKYSPATQRIYTFLVYR